MVFPEENLKEDIWEAQVSANDSREVMSRGIWKVAKDMLGKSRGFRIKNLGSWKHVFKRML